MNQELDINCEIGKFDKFSKIFDLSTFISD